MSELIMIAATTYRGGIGFRGSMPWHIPEELEFFKRTTYGHTVIMGRKTFESIGRALTGRRNIVVSSKFDAPGIEVVSSPDEALALVKNEKAFVIGGAEIYRAFMPYADTLIITRIQHSYACDTFFPRVRRSAWRYLDKEYNTPGSVPETYTVIYKRNIPRVV